MIERINREFGTDRTNILNLTMYCTRLSELGSALRTVSCVLMRLMRVPLPGMLTSMERKTP